MGLMLTTLALLAEEDHEHIRLVTGLPLSNFQKLKEKYLQILLGTHNWGSRQYGIVRSITAPG